MAVHTALMYTAMTQDVQVTVLPQFVPDRSDADASRFFWAYTIEITNRRSRSVQLVSRHWKITDGKGRLEEVRGAGVVGEQPVLQPGDTFRYTSGCPLTTPSGIMAGAYRMIDEDGSAFDVAIPTFSLDSPSMNRVLN
jgi:ApaG protein